MERMEVDPCACAASGGGVLRRSNSAPMITSVSDGSVVFGSSARFRRSSVSVNSSGPSQLLPLSSMPLMTERTEAKRHEDLGVGLRGSLQRLSWSSLSSTPAAPHRASPTPTRGARLMTQGSLPTPPQSHTQIQTFSPVACCSSKEKRRG
ncbi:uncharacterized protein [Eucyclogobius newberryi]|uniref:uncharacterized protein n=1 Tax=Eucyclogobius newberryi TaxID=166745 RepID=UPI003B5A8321